MERGAGGEIAPCSELGTSSRCGGVYSEFTVHPALPRALEMLLSFAAVFICWRDRTFPKMSWIVGFSGARKRRRLNKTWNQRLSGSAAAPDSFLHSFIHSCSPARSASGCQLCWCGPQLSKERRSGKFHPSKCFHSPSFTCPNGGNLGIRGPLSTTIYY